jgi:hypothetical protein
MNGKLPRQLSRMLMKDRPIFTQDNSRDRQYRFLAEGKEVR